MSLPGSAEDASFLRAFAQTKGFLLGRPVHPVVAPDGQAVLFLRSEARSSRHDLFEFDVATGRTRLLCTAAQLQGGERPLSEAEKGRRERQRITDTGLVSFALSPDARWVLLPLAGALYGVSRDSGETWSLLPADHPPVMDARFSPTGDALAFVCNHDLWRLPLTARGLSPVRLTTGGAPDHAFGLPEFVAQEEMHRFEGTWYSPQGDKLLVSLVDEREVERFVIADPAHPERAPHSFRYPRPGKANARVTLHILDAEGREPPVPVVWDHERFPYLARVSWHAAEAPPLLWVQSRDQREAALLLVDVASGRTQVAFTEEDEAWINLDPKLPRWLPDGRGILHVTEADGAPSLQLRSPTGALEATVVPPDAGFLSLVAVQAATNTALVLLGDHLYSHVARVSLAPQGAFAPAPLGAAADHEDASERGDVAWVVTGGPVETPLLVENRVSSTRWPTVRLIDGDGRRLGELPACAEVPPFSVNLELTSVGAEGFAAALIRPRHAVAGQKLPVIVHVYGGPHAVMVRADQRHYVFDQWLADRGAIVVAIDNRGTPRRGRAWERAVKGAFGQVPLGDQVAGLFALGAAFPELDLSRVGIYGWSFGGTLAAQAVLCRPDVYKVAVAGAPVVDWHDYDTHYTERYLDLPARAPSAYASASLLPLAPRLERPLMLVHGTADDNVYFFHALKLADALLRSGRRFDFLPLPGTTHQIGDPEVRERLWARIGDYLFEHL